MRRLLVVGPREAVRAFNPGTLWRVTTDVCRSSQLAPIDLVRTMTARDEIVLLDGWDTDHDACSLVALGLWLGLPFHRLERGRLVRCTPRSPVLEFVDAMRVLGADLSAVLSDATAGRLVT